MILRAYGSKVIDGATNIRQRRSRGVRRWRFSHARSGAANRRNAKAECDAKESSVSRKSRREDAHSASTVLDTDDHLRVPVLAFRRDDCRNILISRAP